MSKLNKQMKKFFKNKVCDNYNKLPGSGGVKILIFIALFCTYFVYEVIRDIAKEKLAESIKGVKFTSNNIVNSPCADGADRYYSLNFSTEVLIDLDFEKMLLFEEYKSTDEYKDTDGSLINAKKKPKSYLEGYELALTYIMGDIMQLGVKGFPFILRRHQIGTAKLLQNKIKNVNLDILKSSLKNKTEGPSPLSDGLWGLKTSEDNYAAIYIDGMPSPDIYPSIPKKFIPKIEICYFEDSWF